MKRTLRVLTLIVGTLLMMLAFWFPLVLSVVTGNWWYLSLFLISWIPAFYIVVGSAILVELIKS